MLAGGERKTKTAHVSPYRQTHSGQFGSLVQKNSAMVPFAALHDQPLPQPLLLLVYCKSIAMMSRMKKVVLSFCVSKSNYQTVKGEISAVAQDRTELTWTVLGLEAGDHLTVPLPQMICATHNTESTTLAMIMSFIFVPKKLLFAWIR